MGKSKLCVCRFRSDSGNDYVFDNASGMIVPCSEAMYEIIKCFYEETYEEILHRLKETYQIEERTAGALYRKVKNLIDNGCFYKEDMPIQYGALTEEDVIKSPISQLILIVTEECNIRCQYCIYSENYPHVKGYSKKMMDFEVAKKAIDCFMELHQKRVESGYRRKPVITFYGGEPLLRFDLIKQVVAYCKEQEFDARYFVTTNATLMTDEVIDFIIEHEIVVTFSLDGFKENNDRNRIFSNGQGTYDIIMRNVMKLQEEKKRRNIVQAISFSCCFDSYTDMCAVVEFFDKNHELFSPYNIIYNQIGQYNTTYYDYCDQMHKKGVIKESPDTFQNTVTQLQEKFIQSAVHNKRIESVGLNYLFMGLINIIWRSKGEMKQLDKTACVPGSKIAVEPDGNFFVCEKVSQMCSIGDINSSIDMEKINVLNDKLLEIREKHCKDCSLSRLCPLCYMHLAEDNDMKFNYKLCEDNKKKIPASLKTVVSVLEKNPNAFDILAPEDPKRGLYEL